MKFRTLADLKKGETAVIGTLGETDLTHQFMEMGLLPGTSVTVDHLAPFGGPIIFTIQGTYSLSLRKSESQMIEVI